MGKRKQPHTATYKFHKVKVRLDTGEVFIDRFLDRKSNFVIFQNRGKIRKASIQSFVPFHAENHGSHHT